MKQNKYEDGTSPSFSHPPLLFFNYAKSMTCNLHWLIHTMGQLVSLHLALITVWCCRYPLGEVGAVGGIICSLLLLEDSCTPEMMQ